MKRLLLATDAWHPQVNGVVRVLDRISREAATHGLQVDILSADGFRTVGLPTYSEIRVAMCRPSAVAERIESIPHDYVHIATEGPIGLMTRMWCRSRKRPFTTSFHTRYPEYVAARFPVPVSLSYAWLRRFHNSGIGTMVSNERLASDLASRGFSKTLLWPRGVDTDHFSPGRPAEVELPRPIFAYIGRVAVEKNIKDFLKLDLPGSKIVVGEGPALARLKQAYPNVHFLGLRQGEELVGLYRAADVFVFPSRTDTLGLVMIEALCCGTPVAAYPVPGPLDVVGASGAGVLDEDLQKAALAALDIKRERCREHGRSFSASKSVEIFVNLILEANEARRPAAA